ncbi:hypothetical protein XI03_03470 [Bradyrhizobium sp. CCBAU 65884]|nr:hypothetical protein [Bradyrhizobium sp. CCBAU 65884]
MKITPDFSSAVNVVATEAEWKQHRPRSCAAPGFPRLLGLTLSSTATSRKGIPSFSSVFRISGSISSSDETVFFGFGAAQ